MNTGCQERRAISGKMHTYPRHKSPNEKRGLACQTAYRRTSALQGGGDAPADASRWDEIGKEYQGVLPLCTVDHLNGDKV